MRNQPTLFEPLRIRMDEAMQMTVDSLRSYADQHNHWAIAWSGGKDSTTVLTLVIHLLETGQLPRPQCLTIAYADTRMELPPLAAAAQETIRILRERGYDVRTVMAPIDRRMLVYILGRGVPPPNNNTLRYCTRMIKVEPMQAEIQRLVSEDGDALMLTGVRVGESAARDARIALSCGRNGSECGQGWYQEMKGERLATLAPILHWRVCHVWDWLSFYAPEPDYGGWPTRMLAAAYGGDEAAEINARTGCIGCPLASQDTALDACIARPEWAYLAPLKELRPVYRELREPHRRLRKPGGETRKDGSLVDNQHRMGPLTMDARRWALAEILDIQERCNIVARVEGRPLVDILNAEEITRIEEMIAGDTWPQRWSGEEPRADEHFEEIMEGALSLPTLGFE